MKKLFTVLLFLLASVFGFGQTMTYTPNMSLGLAPHGYPNWDAVVNQNFSTIDTLSMLKSGSTMTGLLTVTPATGTQSALFNAPITIATTTTAQPILLLQGTGAAPVIGLFRTDAGTDLKHWAIGPTVDGTLHIGMANDVGTAGADAITCIRSGATPNGCIMTSLSLVPTGPMPLNTALNIDTNSQPGIFNMILKGEGSGPPITAWDFATAGPGLKTWVMGVDTNSNFYLATTPDPGVSGPTLNALQCTRNGATPSGCLMSEMLDITANASSSLSAALYVDTNNQPGMFNMILRGEGAGPPITAWSFATAGAGLKTWVMGVDSNSTFYIAATPDPGVSGPTLNALQCTRNGATPSGCVISPTASAPTGVCTVGSLATNTAATSASTVLFVCYPANVWTAVAVP